MSYYDDIARPAFTADAVVIAGSSRTRSVLLVQRGNPPFEGAWALPGGFVEPGETPRAAARRELAEETGLEWAGPLVLVGVYGEPGRDPRGWTVSAAYLAVGDESFPRVIGSDDAAAAAWFTLGDLPELAFDHALVVADAVAMLAG